MSLFCTTCVCHSTISILKSNFIHLQFSHFAILVIFSLFFALDSSSKPLYFRSVIIIERKKSYVWCASQLVSIVFYRFLYYGSVSERLSIHYHRTVSRVMTKTVDNWWIAEKCVSITPTEPKKTDFFTFALLNNF